MMNLADVRQKLMTDRKIICTGNPDKPFTIASGIKRLFPNATFLCLSNGWDLTDLSLDRALKDKFADHNTFINASYIAPDVQSRLLSLCHQSIKFCDVVNCGSTHEYDQLGNVQYERSKRALRDLSLKLNTFRFRTCHLIIGHIATDEQANERQIPIDLLCRTMFWALEQPFDVPIMSIVNKKMPW